MPKNKRPNRKSGGRKTGKRAAAVVGQAANDIALRDDAGDRVAVLVAGFSFQFSDAKYRRQV